MPSFDIVSEVEMQEVDNALHQSVKEIETRYDFKGSKSSLEREENVIVLLADDDYKREQVLDILKTKLIRRKVDPKSLDYGKVEEASGSMVRQRITVRQGVEEDKAKQIVKRIKEAGLKVQTAIQGNQLRVTGKKKDDLQSVIALLREVDVGQPLQFTNFRD
ncbi:MAG: YajQ family cyclic di-GMP-binding protein [Magnetococcales bacterium]|nr:YajQ family cyclic di-GMP-binding protein [Magnetococcales bacterium]